MSLAVLRLNKAKQLKETERQALIVKRGELKAAGDNLVKSIDEAATVDDMSLIESEITTHEAAVDENEAAILMLDAEIDGFDKEIADAQVRAQAAGKPKLPGEMKTRGDKSMADENIFYRVRNITERKERMAKALQLEDTRAKDSGKEQSELREFFAKIHKAVTRENVLNSELLIPEVLLNMIEIDLQFIGGITGLITLRPISGTTRIVMAGDAPEAVWVEMTGAIPKMKDLEFSYIELDGYKLAGFLSVHNSIIEDAFINLAAHVQEQMVKGFKLALDKAVLNGTGAADKQPEGIIPSIPATNKVTSGAAFDEYLANYSILPDDADIEAAVMTRKTYFEYFMPQTVHVDSAGRVVVANMQKPVLPDGTPVVFVRKSADMLTDGQVLTGQFSKYFMAQRKGMTLQSSTEVRFLQDQTVFKVLGRFDGKPLNSDYFLLITLNSGLYGGYGYEGEEGGEDEESNP